MADAAIWDKMARKYAQSPIRNEAAYKEKLARTQDWFTPDTEVFEFGCGTGTTALNHAPHVRKVVATDICANMLEIGQEKAAAANITNVEFRQLGMDDYVPEPNCCDAVLALNLVHLLRDPAAIANVYSMLKPGGVFVQSTVCLGDSGGAKMLLWRVLIPIMQLIGKAPYVAYLRRDELLSALQDAGFELVYQRGFSG